MSSRLRLALLLSASFAILACRDPAASVPSATVAEAGTGTGAAEGTAEAAPGTGAADSAAAALEGTAASAGTGAATAGTGSAIAPGPITFNLTPSNASVAFVGSKVTRSHEGSFGNFQGTLTVDLADLTKTSVQASIEIASITSDNPDLTEHLKSPELLDAAAFPQATFSSTAFAALPAGAPDGNTHTVTGDFTLHGVTKSITFPIRVGVTDTAVTANAEFAINRQDFGVTYPGRPDDLIRDNVVIRLALNLPRP